MRINELFGVFRNNVGYDKAQARNAQAKKNPSQKTDGDADEDDKEDDQDNDNVEKQQGQQSQQKRSNSTRGTQPTKGPGQQGSADKK